MDTPTSIQPPRKRYIAVACISVSFAIALLALNHIATALHQFYLDTATLAPGTGVRPMGLTLDIGTTWTASIVFGGGCALIGGIIGLIQRRQSVVVFAILAAILAWIPMLYSWWGFRHVLELRKLILLP